MGGPRRAPIAPRGRPWFGRAGSGPRAGGAGSPGAGVDRLRCGAGTPTPAGRPGFKGLTTESVARKAEEPKNTLLWCRAGRRSLSQSALQGRPASLVGRGTICRSGLRLRTGDAPGPLVTPAARGRPSALGLRGG